MGRPSVSFTVTVCTMSRVLAAEDRLCGGCAGCCCADRSGTSAATQDGHDDDEQL